MTAEQAALFARAERVLRAARLLLDAGDPLSAVNRVYYGAYYAASAALLGRGESPKTHSGTLHRFYFHFVKLGVLDTTVATALKVALDAREQADYDTFAELDSDVAAEILADVKHFVIAVRRLVEEERPPALPL